MKFWTSDLSILFSNGNYMYFIPTPNMSRIEQLNALSRFFIYYFVLLIIFQKNDRHLFVPIIGLIFIIFLNYIYENEPKSRLKEYVKVKSNISKKNQLESEQQEYNADLNKIEENILQDSNEVLENVESGYIDSSGDLIINRKQALLKNPKDIINYGPNELMEYQKNVCIKPTSDNPFMNPPVTDFNKENIPVSCNADDDEIKNMIDNKFNENLYRDIDDLFDVKNSQRIWYTIPAPSIPPDQSAFANWLYKNEGTCKTNQNMCLRYEDLRYKGRIY